VRPGDAASTSVLSGPSIAGHRVELLSSIDSTNAEARRRICAGRDVAGLVLVAVDQTAGRGRRGHTWHCVPGRSLITTLVLVQPTLPRLSRVTVLTAVAACRALENAGSPPMAIKWPNDLMRGEGKLGGILVEQVTSPQGQDLLLVGVGINLSLRPGDLPDELNALATDAALAPTAACRDQALRQLVEGLDGALAALGTPADHAWGQEYARRSWLNGRRVSLQHEGRQQTVDIASVSAEGDLLLGDGRTLRGEHVQLLSSKPHS